MRAFKDRFPRQSGTGMIEVLVALLVLLVGLLGLAGLSVQALRSEMESYQRVQAITLLLDMNGRINANRKAASCYAFTNATNGTPYLGINATATPACATGTASQQAIAIQDMNDWSALLSGAAETTGGSNAGAMIGARGCVSYDATQEVISAITGLPIAGSGIYTVSVAWQGMGDTFAPAGLNCGKNLYGSEAKRRVVSSTIRIANLL